ncbi:hypothetical protein TIFTF001_001161 [Ficus carica]|uniref:Uncharacterized protein n=1 Tax=Ficus carica TaxID=3494 RepID=A0AA87YYT4_FICCA|nr:hypothetical protein TIFTF001_001161 [Ficus carica]
MPKKPETKRKLKSAPKGSRLKSAQIVKNATEVLAQFVPLQFQQPIRLAQSFFNKLPQFRSTISAVAKEEVAAKKIFLFPTASELEKVGVMFFKAHHITDIKFDPATATFHLPSLKIDANFEVIIRNLVAYEAMIMSETQPPILNWYVELMNGLIETAEDVEVLEEIILKPESIDAERVANIFNAMNKSVEFKNIPDNLDKAVKSVKEHYTRETKETESTFMEKCRRTVSKWCQVFAVLLALFLLSVQTVCSVYDCPRFSFKTSNITPQAQQGLQLPSLRSHLT